MSQQVYSVCITSQDLPAGITVVGPAPAGTRWVVRSMSVAYPASGGQTVSLRFDKPAIYVVRLPLPTAVPWAYWEGRIVVPDGTALLIDRGTTGGGVTISGYQLSLP